MTVARLPVPFPFEAEGMLRTVVYAGEAEFAFSADLQTFVSQSEVAARTHLCTCGTFDASSGIELDELLAGL